MYHFRGSMLYVDNSSFPYNDIAINKESRLSNFSSISNFSITSKNKNNTDINVNNNTNDDSAIYLLTKNNDENNKNEYPIMDLSNVLYKLIRCDSVNTHTYKQISEYYLQNYMQYYSLFDLSNFTFRSCLFPFIYEKKYITDIHNMDLINYVSNINNSHNIVFTPFLIFLFKRILPQFICLNYPSLRSPYSLNTFKKKYPNMEKYYALRNNENKNLTYLRHIVNFYSINF